MHEARLGRGEAPSPAGILDGLVMLAGLYLLLSPFIYNEGLTRLAVSNLIVGLTLVLLAVGYARNFHSLSSIAWTIPIIGIWVIVSPWVINRAAASPRTFGDVGAPSMSAWTWLGNVVAGSLIVLAGLGAAWFGWKASRPRHVDRHANRHAETVESKESKESNQRQRAQPSNDNDHT